jgi:tripartite-type tricarboxylate transporter receptor subunit TctC
MTQSRHLRLGMVFASVMLLGVGQSARQQAYAQEADPNYPSREVKFVCGFPAGSGADTYVRYYAEKFRQASGRTVVVENRVGANGNIATAYSAKAKPDGYTIYLNAPSGLAANMHLFKNPGTDAVKELTIVATFNRQPFMITTGADRPWKTLPELVAAMRQKGEKGSYATNNPTGRVTGAWFLKVMGLNTTEVQYKTGADTLNDLASGALDFAAHDPVTAVAQRNAGRLRILGVAVKERMKAMPDVPTLHEQGGTDIDLPSWWAAMVPTGTPKPVQDRLHALFNQITSSDETREFFAKFGADTWVMTQEQALKQFQDDFKAWGEHIKLAKIEPQG